VFHKANYQSEPLYGLFITRLYIEFHRDPSISKTEIFSTMSDEVFVKFQCYAETVSLNESTTLSSSGQHHRPCAGSKSRVGTWLHHPYADLFALRSSPAG
jgi:hypothetical protein